MPIVRNKKIEVLFSAKDLKKRNHELAEEIALSDVSNLLVVSVLKGSFVFAADLIRAMYDAGLFPEVEFITVSSYGAGTQSGELKLLRDIETDVCGRDVLLVDDILESGKTMQYTRDLMLERGAKKVSIVTLLDKSVKRTVDINADYVGFECPDKFVVGYGMDAGHAFRELPFVGIISGEV